MGRPRPGTGGAAGQLTRQGWRAAPLGPRDRLDAVWQELGRTSTQVSRTSLAAALPDGVVR